MNEETKDNYVTITPPQYLLVSIKEYEELKKLGVLMKVKEIEEIVEQFDNILEIKLAVKAPTREMVIKVLQQLVEREEEMLQKTIEIQNKENSEVWQLSCENAVLAKQDTISYLKYEIAKLSTNIDKE